MSFEADAAAAIKALQGTLRAALLSQAGNAQAVLQDAFRADPELFFEAAYRLLEAPARSTERQMILAGILDRPEFLLALIHPDRFVLNELIRICRNFHSIDRKLDLRLARLLPGRWEDVYSLSTPVIVRVLHVLNGISVGSRLIHVISHLTNHRDPAIAESATLLIGKRVRNWGWQVRRLESGGPEIRAGVVEGLWGVDTPQARRTMRTCLQDASDRVVGKAVFGLHLLQEDDVQPLVERMAVDDRSGFRATAAWLAGKIHDPEYGKLLERALHDSSDDVRQAAKEAVAARQQAALEQQQAQPAEPPKPEPQPDPKPAPTPTPKPAPKPRQRELRLTLDGTSTTTRWD